MKNRAKLLLAVLLAAALLLNACGAAKQPQTEGEYSGQKLRLAVQYGMQYAPAYVVQELGLLEEALPGISLEWSNLGGGSAMNDGLISGSLDVAFMGIPPALIAIDAGAEYRIACGICVPPAQLMLRADAGVSSLAELEPQQRIAVPSIGSIQHIMLAMACEQQLGDAAALDNNLIVISNPDAYASLLSGGEISGHFASMPYIAYEQDNGMVSILDAEDCLGSGASIVCVTNQLDDAVYTALMEALVEAVRLINERDEQALAIIAEREQLSAEQVLEYLEWEGTLYSTDIYSLSPLGEFMATHGYLKHEFAGFSAFCNENAVEAQ